MKEMLVDYLGFLLEAVTVLAVFIIAVGFVFAKGVSSAGGSGSDEEDACRVVIRNESESYRKAAESLRRSMLDEESGKCLDDFLEKRDKAAAERKSGETKKLKEALKALSEKESAKNEKKPLPENDAAEDKDSAAAAGDSVKEQDQAVPEKDGAEEQAARSDSADDTDELSRILDSAEKKPRLFILDFRGDVMASDVRDLRRLVSSVLAVGRNGDEVLLRLESPGGSVPHYGLAASELMRIRRSGMKFTVCVDRVAASGGYMMACTSEHIVAAPFAIVGSIGVVAEFPNFHRLLDKLLVDYEQETAGEYKRTLSMFGDNSDPAARKKFEEQLSDIHAYFKKFVKSNRPAIDIDSVATGEFWFGEEALERHLIDEIMTSDDYVISRMKTHSVWRLRAVRKKKFGGILDRFMHSRAGGSIRGMLRHLPVSRLRS